MSLSASHIAVGLVAAAKQVGIAAGDVFEDVKGAPKARVIVAATVVGLGLAMGKDAARILQVPPVAITPSHLPRWRVTLEDLEAVAAALKAAGLVATDVPLSTAPAEAAAPPRDKAEVRTGKVGPAAPARRAGPGWAPKRPRSGGERASGGGGRWTGPRDGIQRRVITRHGPDTARPSGSPIEAARGAVRLKPVTDRIVRWAGFFPPECWSHDEIAALFDVHPDALLDAMDPPLAGEAA